MNKNILIPIIIVSFMLFPVVSAADLTVIPDEIAVNIVEIPPKTIPEETLLDNGELLIVPSKDFPFKHDYLPPKLQKIRKNTSGPIPSTEDFNIAENTYQPLLRLMSFINQHPGCQLIICSAHRSFSTQKQLFREKVARIIALHLEFKNDPSKAEKIAEVGTARPGISQHMTGRVIDFTTLNWYKDYLAKTSSQDPIKLRETSFYLRNDFLETPEGRLLQQNAYRFGFILPYSKEKTAITGYRYEPWHYLYVGQYHAELIFKGKWTLPEYYNFIFQKGMFYYKFHNKLLKYSFNPKNSRIEVFSIKLRKQFDIWHFWER